MATQPATTSSRPRARSRAHAPRKRAASKRARIAPRPKRPSEDQAGKVGLAVTFVRVVVGGVSLGSDELARRLRAIPQEADSRRASGPERGRHGSLGLGYLAAGLAAKSAEVAGRLVSTAAHGGRRRAARGRRPRAPAR